jgi:hypothetical protein
MGRRKRFFLNHGRIAFAFVFNAAASALAFLKPSFEFDIFPPH